LSLSERWNRDADGDDRDVTMTEVDLHEDDFAFQVWDVAVDVEFGSGSEGLVKGMPEHPDGPAEDVPHCRRSFTKRSCKKKKR
jgi:hypothetical protein